MIICCLVNNEFRYVFVYLKVAEYEIANVKHIKFEIVKLYS